MTSIPNSIITGSLEPDGPWLISVAESSHSANTYCLYIKTSMYDRVLVREKNEILSLNSNLLSLFPSLKLPELPISITLSIDELSLNNMIESASDSQNSLTSSSSSNSASTNTTASSTGRSSPGGGSGSSNDNDNDDGGDNQNVKLEEENELNNTIKRAGNEFDQHGLSQDDKKAIHSIRDLFGMLSQFSPPVPSYKSNMGRMQYPQAPSSADSYFSNTAEAGAGDQNTGSISDSESGSDGDNGSGNSNGRRNKPDTVYLANYLSALSAMELVRNSEPWKTFMTVRNFVGDLETVGLGSGLGGVGSVVDVGKVVEEGASAIADVIPKGVDAKVKVEKVEGGLEGDEKKMGSKTVEGVKA